MKRAVLLLLLAAAAGSAVVAQESGALPAELQEIGVTQNLDAVVPLELEFVDEEGERVRLAEFFSEGRPVLVSLVYYRCPMLCNVLLQGLVDTLKEMDWRPGEQFEIVTVTIDPREKPELARKKKSSILEAYGRPEAARGWHFLTGDAPQIEMLADALGFRYKYLPAQREFAHPAALFVITPDGRISRYMFGVRQDPQSLRLSLVEAAEGKVGSLVDQFLLYCYRYDAETGLYTPVAWRIMRLGGLLTLLVLGCVLALFWRREVRSRRLAKRTA